MSGTRHSFSYELPDFYMPYPSYGMNPHVEDVQGETLEWLDSFKVLRGEMRNHLLRTRPQVCTGFFYPWCDREMMVLGNQYMACTFVIDDIFDDAITEHDTDTVAVFAQDLLDATRRRRGFGGGSITRAWADLIERLNEGRSSGWIEMFAMDNERWIHSYVTEARRAKTGMSLAEYLEHRAWSFDCVAFLQLAERLNGIDVRPEIRALPGLADARRLSSQWGGLHNDIWSADKEIAMGYPHNAVVIGARHLSCSVTRSIALVDGILDGLMIQYQAAGEAAVAQLRFECVGDGEFSEAARLIENYNAMTRGYYDYYLDGKVRRYHPEEYMLDSATLRPLHARDDIIDPNNDSPPSSI